MERASVGMVGSVNACMRIAVGRRETAQSERPLLLLRREQWLEVPWRTIALDPPIPGFGAANDRERYRILFRR